MHAGGRWQDIALKNKGTILILKYSNYDQLFYKLASYSYGYNNNSVHAIGYNFNFWKENVYRQFHVQK